MRYISGLLIFALASAVIMIALDRVNSFRHDIDALSSNLVAFTRDLRNATSFAETTAYRLAGRDTRCLDLIGARPFGAAEPAKSRR